MGRGIAVCFSYGSCAAHVAEVSVADDGAVRIRRLVCAIDCGIVVNPNQVRAQMEGGAVYAMTATLYGRITLDAGRVQQTNFHMYPRMRIGEVPVTEVQILDSGHPPGGLGEPGVPTVAPAQPRPSPPPVCPRGLSVGFRASSPDLPPPLPCPPALRYRSGAPPAAGPTPPARERGDGARSRDAETCFGLPTFSDSQPWGSIALRRLGWRG
jgi:hypothetical protein